MVSMEPAQAGPLPQVRLQLRPMWTTWELLESADSGHDHLFGAAFILLIESAPTFKAVSFLPSSEGDSSLVDAVVQGMVAHETPKDL